MAKGAHKTPNFRTTLVDLWHAVTSGLFDTYHPERHYMRGPGPKWREKHAQVARTADVSFGHMTQAAA
jgi:hypothetical protein